LPTLISLFIFKRHRVTMKLIRKQQLFLCGTLIQFTWAMKNWPMFTFCTPEVFGLQAVRRHFMTELQAFTQCARNVRIYIVDSEWVVTCLSGLANLAFVLFGAYALMEREHYGQGTMTVGTFYAILKIYEKTGKAIRSMVQSLERIQGAAVSLKYVSQILNASDGRHEHLKSDIRTQEDINRSAEDGTRLGLMLEDVSYQYEEEATVFTTINIQIAFNNSFVLMGSPGANRHTLLRLLGQVVQPSSGSAWIYPPARFCIMPETQHMVLENVVLKNLQVGSALWCTDDDVALIGRALGLPSVATSNRASVRRVSGLHEDLFSDDDPPEGSEVWSPDDKFLFGVGRCLLADSDVLFAQVGRMSTAVQRRSLRLLLLWHQLGGLKGLLRSLHEAEEAPTKCHCFPDSDDPGCRDSCAIADDLISAAECKATTDLNPRSGGHDTILGVLAGSTLQLREHLLNGVHIDTAVYIHDHSNVEVGPIQQFINASINSPVKVDPAPVV